MRIQDTYSDEYVYVSLCLSLCEDISATTRAICTKLLVHVAYGRGSIFLRRRGRSLLPTVAFLIFFNTVPCSKLSGPCIIMHSLFTVLEWL